MVKRGNLIVILFLLIIFILFFSSQISAQDFSYSNNQIAFLDMLGLNTIDNSFMINQGLKFPVQKATNQKSCSGVSKLDIFDFRTDFSFEEKIKNNQPIIHPTLEETNIMRIENKVKIKN